MKNLLIVFFIGISTTFFSQQIDYNTKKGYIAEGYDVVEYFNDNAKEGNENFSTTYDKVKFKFIAAENLEKFKKNPVKDTPQYGEFCAYAVGADAERVSINLKTHEIRDRKLYLFYNSWFNNTLKSWKKNPKKLQKQGAENWMEMKK